MLRCFLIEAFYTLVHTTNLPLILTEFESRAFLSVLVALFSAILQTEIRSHAEVSQLVELGLVIINQKVC